MSSKLGIGKISKQQLDLIAKMLWLNRLTSVSIGKEGIVITLTNGEKIIFDRNKETTSESGP